MTEAQFLHRVPWGKANQTRETAIRFVTKCPIDAAGGVWSAPGGALALPKLLHLAILTAADVTLAELERQHAYYYGRVKTGRVFPAEHPMYAENLERVALSMRLRILFRARISDARSFKENKTNV